MGSRDFRKKELKKPKKGTKKISAVDILPPPMTVDIVKKEKKKERTEEE
ncbi:hypothetical protein ACFLTZ_00545 [Chloroflexota bacterium]